MRSLPLILLLVACGAPPQPYGVAAAPSPTKPGAPEPPVKPQAKPPAPKGTVVIGKQAVAVGAMSVELEQRTTHMEMSSEGKLVEVERNEQRRKRSEVLAVKDGRVTKLRVHYEIHRITKRRDGEIEKPSDTIVEGMTFVVERTATGVRVLDEHERKITGGEAAFVAKDFKGLGRPKGLESFPARPLVIGERVRELEDGLVSDATKNGMGRARGVELRLVDVTGDVATFQGKFEVTDDKAEMHSRFKTLFEVRVSDGRPLRVSFSGPIVLTTDKVQGAGTVSMVSEWAYPQPLPPPAQGN